MEFNYNVVKMSIGILDVEDLGNLAIEAYNEKGLFYYLVIRTALGTTSIFEYGPIVPDVHMLPKKVNCLFERIEFKEPTLAKRISQWLNNPSKEIIHAELVDYDRALDSCKDIVSYMKNFNEENNY